jgi:hypothetical protein
VLEFKGRIRKVMSPGLYTELFFLDEATALTAGHRPCAECRRDSFDAFRNAWVAVGLTTAAVKAPEIDSLLHEERLETGGTKWIHQAGLDELPDAVFVRLACRGDVAWLLWNGLLLAWSARGYRGRLPRPCGVGVDVLTPPSTVATIRAGYSVEVNETAG